MNIDEHKKGNLDFRLQIAKKMGVIPFKSFQHLSTFGHGVAEHLSVLRPRQWIGATMSLCRLRRLRASNW